MISGPEGTPYSCGLFVFDIYCPASYPNTPPKLRLRTTGGGCFRFHPNLYHTGHVCLSLLGTWIGQASELWMPSSSTLLQVPPFRPPLVSVLVLSLSSLPILSPSLPFSYIFIFPNLTHSVALLTLIPASYPPSPSSHSYFLLFPSPRPHSLSHSHHHSSPHPLPHPHPLTRRYMERDHLVTWAERARGIEERIGE